MQKILGITNFTKWQLPTIKYMLNTCYRYTNTTYKYKIRSTTNSSIPEMAENRLHMIEKNKAPDLNIMSEKRFQS